MAREIELKVPLSEEQFDKIQRILSKQENLSSFKFHSLEHIIKCDEYFSRYHTHEERIANKELRVIRIRTEKLVEQCEDNKEKAYFCIKRKTIENGVEFNSEKETFVDDAEVLRAFFEAAGFIKWFEKKKDALGVICSLDGSDFEAHLEIEKVNGLPYAEIEYTKDDLSADEVRSCLEKILLTLGIDPKKRDSRSWAEILGR
ncbi:hypothetical protein [uncultured Treponema sp.]|uniref:hypothetical protein n=1 Tax=uncultured Treponema sp. TaxID=162155 RepID=UPI0025D171BD|nr:hypothetical protein [uncultured Treponema sp.]